MKAATPTGISVPRTRMRSSTKIALAFLVIVVGSLLGFRAYSAWRVGNLEFEPLTPGVVNILGVEAGSGYRVIVANGIAQLVQVADGKFEAQGGDMGTEGALRKRMPIREMLQSLQGNEEALSRFVMVLNEIKTDELPPVPIYWSAADLQRAIDGDPELQASLERDLNIRLDGTPLDTVSLSALESGIVIRAPVPIRVRVGGEPQTLTATILQEYQPRLMQTVKASYRERPEVTREIVAGLYLQAAREVLEDESRREDVRRSIQARIDPARLAQFAKAPEQVLANSNVLVTENHITRADYRSYNSTRGTMHDLTVKLTPEGRDRLWQYSRGRVNSQLLLIVNGIAIAAPRIQHELAQGELTITQMPDEVLVRDAVEIINENNRKGKVAN
jgi:hypothetical protein